MSRSIGPCKVIEDVMLRVKKQNLAPGAGFEPARGPCPTGSQGLKVHGLKRGLSKRGFPSNVGSQGVSIGGKVIRLPPVERFKEWLGRQVSESTLKAYINYYFAKLPGEICLEDLPKLVTSSWMYKLLSKIVEYLWEVGELSFEDKERIRSLIRRSFSRKSRKEVSAPIVSVEEFLETISYLRKHDPHYFLAYRIMFYSGARLQEACWLIGNIGLFHVKLPQREFRVRGCVDLGEAVRLNVHWNRGFKRCSHLWLPKKVFYEIKPVTVSSRAVSYYARDHGLMQPKLVRKLHYQILEDLIEDVSLRDFMQNRYMGLTVGDTNYSKLVLRADRAYVEKVLPKLRKVLGEKQ